MSRSACSPACCSAYAKIKDTKIRRPSLNVHVGILLNQPEKDTRLTRLGPQKHELVAG